MSELIRYPSDGHLIYSCRWLTTLDDEEYGSSLQVLLSDWSRAELREVAGRVLDEQCVVGRRWQIETLTLDLGPIDYANIRRDLPRKFRDCLQSKLRQLKTHNGSVNLISESDDKTDSALNDIRAFLLTGSMPWWSRGRESNLELISRLVDQSGPTIVEILREIGTEETVRKRIVRQYKEPILRRIIKLLEPHDYNVIFSFMEHLQQSQEKQALVGASQPAFRQHTWYWVLTHILVERGTQFNTAQFVQSNIQQMSRRFNVSYRLLLENIINASEALTQNSRRKPAFLQVIYQLRSEVSIANKSKATTTIDLWTVFEHAVSTSNTRVNTGDSMVSLSELFLILVKHNASRVAKLMSQLGRQDSVRKKLIRLLEKPELALWAQLMVPVEAGFMVTLVERLQSVVAPKKPEVVWEIVLTGLMARKDNYFDRRQFIQVTIEALAQRLNRTYLELLVAILFAPDVLTDEHGFGLVLLLQELYKETKAKKTESVDIASLHRQALIHYLETGESVEVLAGRRLPTSELLLKSFLSDGDRELVEIMKLLRTNRQRSLNMLARRLVEIGGPEQFSSIIRALDPRASVFVSWLNQMLRESKQSAPQLFLLDDRYVLDTVIIETLLLRKFSVSHIMDALTQWITLHSSMHTYDWLYQLTVCMEKSAPIQCSKELECWLSRQVVTDVNHGQFTHQSWQSVIRHKRSLANEADRKQELMQPENGARGVLAVTSTKQANDNSVRNRSLTTVTMFLLSNGRLPSWYDNCRSFTAKSLVKQTLTKHAGEIQKCVYDRRTDRRLMYRLHSLTIFDDVIEVMKDANPKFVRDFAKLQVFYSGMEKIELPSVTRRTLKKLVHEQLLDRWINSNWNERTFKLILSFIVNFLLVQEKLLANEVVDAFTAAQKQLPSEAIQFVNALADAEANPSPNKTKVIKSTVPAKTNEYPKRSEINFPRETATSISINNAGLILVQDYIRLYFSRLDLLKEDQFISDKSQRDAVHYLQYLVTGQIETEEQYLLLNKLLSGLPLSEPIEHSIEICSDHQDLAEGLLTAMINNWKAVHGSSVAGFRGNWLLRDGTLLERDDHWALAVEKRAYDCLLNQAPYSLSTIKYAWMEKPIYETWPH